jgi:D-alanine-D-alanine ligase
MAFKPKKKLRILALLDQDLIPPDNIKELPEEVQKKYENEYDVISTLKEMGHEIRIVGVAKDVRVIRASIEGFQAEVAFNLIVEMHGYSMFEPHVVSYLELIQLPYTGCNPRGLMLAHDKALTKEILTYHRIPVPEFAVFPRNRTIRRPPRLKFPLLVKSLVEEGSVGISKASIVNDDEALAERVEFVHRKINSHAIAEQYIEGREIYVAMTGNQRLEVFTPWELLIEKRSEGEPLIATSKIKWDRAYQEKVGLSTRPAELTPEIKKRLDHVSRRIYRILNLSGYARLDFRLSPDGVLYLLEANPNPDISYGEDFAEAANHSGTSYEQLLQKIVNLGISYRPFV